MKTVEIPGGNAQLREKHEIKVRHRRLIEAASVGAAVALSKLPTDQDELETATLTDLKLTKDEAGSLFELQDATIVAALDSWTRPEAIPTLATVGDLDPEVYDAQAYTLAPELRCSAGVEKPDHAAWLAYVDG